MSDDILSRAKRFLDGHGFADSDALAFAREVVRLSEQLNATIRTPSGEMKVYGLIAENQRLKAALEKIQVGACRQGQIDALKRCAKDLEAIALVEYGEDKMVERYFEEEIARLEAESAKDPR